MAVDTDDTRVVADVPLVAPGAPAAVPELAEPAEFIPLRYHELAEFSRDGYVVTDRAGIILEANQAAAVILHCRKEFLAGKPLALFVAKSYRDQFFRRLLRPLEPGTLDHWETSVGR